MSDGPSFVCIDCHYEVYVFGDDPTPRTRCATCQWIADVPDPVERERVRQWLKDVEKDHDQPAP